MKDATAHTSSSRSTAAPSDQIHALPSTATRPVLYQLLGDSYRSVGFRPTQVTQERRRPPRPYNPSATFTLLGYIVIELTLAPPQSAPVLGHETPPLLEVRIRNARARTPFAVVVRREAHRTFREGLRLVLATIGTSSRLRTSAPGAEAAPLATLTARPLPRPQEPPSLSWRGLSRGGKAPPEPPQPPLRCVSRPFGVRLHGGGECSHGYWCFVREKVEGQSNHDSTYGRSSSRTPLARPPARSVM